MTSLVEEYLELQGGSPEKYRLNLEQGQRLGQAFFNALSSVDQGRLVGTMRDPFYSNEQSKIIETLEFLIDTAPREKNV